MLQIADWRSIKFTHSFSRIHKCLVPFYHYTKSTQILSNLSIRLLKKCLWLMKRIKKDRRALKNFNRFFKIYFHLRAARHKISLNLSNKHFNQFLMTQLFLVLRVSFANFILSTRKLISRLLIHLGISVSYVY